MAKIVIIAPSDVDVTDAVKLLKNNGNDVDVEAPEAKSILHIVLGLFGANAYGFGSDYAIPPPGGVGGGLPPPDGEPPADDESAIEDETTDDGTTDDLDNQDDIDIPDEAAADDFNFESVTVDGETVNGTLVEDEHSTLVVSELDVGPKTTYKLNESKFSFWPADQQKPMQRVDVGAQKWHTSLEVQVVLGEKPELRVGKDLQEIFECECEKLKGVPKKKRAKPEVDDKKA